MKKGPHLLPCQQSQVRILGFTTLSGGAPAPLLMWCQRRPSGEPGLSSLLNYRASLYAQCQGDHMWSLDFRFYHEVMRHLPFPTGVVTEDVIEESLDSHHHSVVMRPYHLWYQWIHVERSNRYIHHSQTERYQWRLGGETEPCPCPVVMRSSSHLGYQWRPSGKTGFLNPSGHNDIANLPFLGGALSEKASQNRWFR